MTLARRTVRYTGYVVLFLLWLVVMLTPCFALTLASLGELEWRRSEHVRDRLWLIQESDYQGLGYDAERIISDDRETGGPVCVRNSVRFFLWAGTVEDQNTEYCECLEPDGASRPLTCP